MENDYYIDKATLSDLPDILALLKTQYTYPVTSPEYWKWRYFNNPVADVSVYVARDHRGQIVSMQPISSYTMSVQGEARRVYLLTGAVTHPEYRRRGLFTRLVKAIEAVLSTSSDLFVFTFPNKQSARGFERFHLWHLREHLGLFIRPLLHPRLLTNLVKNMTKSTKKREPILELKPRPTKKVGEMKIQPIFSFHEGFSSLVQRSPLSKACLIDRTVKYLEWRYAANPVVRYLMYQIDDSRIVKGYLVMKGTILYGLRAGLIVDLIATDNLAAQLLLAQAVIAAKASRFDILGYQVGQFSPYVKALNKAGFMRLPQSLIPRKFRVYVFPHPLSEGNTLAQTINLQPWYIVLGDSDVV
jgi:GNAT superfamily N-acetyltransferase